MLSFFFAVLIIWKIMLPGILTGYDPVWIAFAVVTAISAVTLFLVAGNIKTAMVAWIGSLLGILLTTGISMLLFEHFRLHGAVLPFSETLLYSGFDSLNLEKLFVAAVFLGASGAVIDVAIDVAAAMYEVAHKRPDLSVKELTKSGFAVGRAMVSTMVTTLLMAYLSGYMALLMVLLSKEIPPVQILNLNFIAAEVLKTVVGSFGLVTVAPFTAIVGGILYAKRSQEYEKSESFVISAVQDVQN
ncbi:MAG: YibE/F family protein [Desulfobacterales bacterium]